MVSLKRFVSILLLVAVPLFAVDERRTPQEPEKPKPEEPDIPEAKPPKTPDEEKILVEKLTGVVFVASEDQVVKEGLEFAGVDTSRVKMLDTEEFRKRVEPFLGKAVSFKSIREVARLAIRYYREQDRPFVNISVPEQDITGGVLQFMITEGRLGQVRLEGNKYFRKSQYLKHLRLKPNEPVSANMLIQDINYVNQSIFRRVKPVFKPGAQPGETDLILQAEERFPVRFYLGYEDTGTKTTGLDRLLTGFNWGNAWMAGHELGYQFASDIERERMQSHSGYWRIPLPHRGHKLSISGGYTEIVDQVNQDFESEGLSWQISMRYSAPLPTIGGLRHEGQLGFDFKETDNDLEFGGERVFDSAVDVFQFTLQWAGRAEDAYGATTFGLNGFVSPGNWFSKSGNREFDLARNDTKPDYHYGHLSMERVWKLPHGMFLVNRFRGQVTSERLQSTEQLLLGGFDSVRGYDDRLVNADQGYEAGVELRSPDFFLGKIADMDRFESRIQFHVFWEFARAHNLSDVEGEFKRLTMESAGGGFRFRMGDHLNLRFDYGKRLRTLGFGFDDADGGRIHLGVIASF